MPQWLCLHLGGAVRLLRTQTQPLCARAVQRHSIPHFFFKSRPLVPSMHCKALGSSCTVYQVGAEAPCGVARFVRSQIVWFDSRAKMTGWEEPGVLVRFDLLSSTADPNPKPNTKPKPRPWYGTLLQNPTMKPYYGILLQNPTMKPY